MFQSTERLKWLGQLDAAQPIRWKSDGTKTKQGVCEMCGWSPRTAKRIANTPWEKLSPAAKKVLINHGIRE